MINYVVPFWFDPRGCKKYNEIIQYPKTFSLKKYLSSAIDCANLQKLGKKN